MCPSTFMWHFNVLILHGLIQTKTCALVGLSSFSFYALLIHWEAAYGRFEAQVIAVAKGKFGACYNIIDNILS